MGEAKRKKKQHPEAAWPDADRYRGTIDLHVLPSVAAINGARIRALTGDSQIPDTAEISLRAFRAVVGERTFHVGFCLGNETGFSAIGIAVIERLMMEAPGAALHVVPVVHVEIAWDIVLRHLRSFSGQVLETFQSILKSFVRLDLESVSPPDLPKGWEPDITIHAANGGNS